MTRGRYRFAARATWSNARDRSHVVCWALAIALGIVLIVFLALFVDVRAFHWMRGQDPWVRQVFAETTRLGKAGWMLTVLGIIAIAGTVMSRLATRRVDRAAFAHGAQRAGFVFACIAGIGLAVAILKQLVGRARPLLFDTEGAFSFRPFSGFSHASFPSGDTTNAVVLAMAGGLLFPRARPALWLFAAWIGFGRVVTERHYVSDVVAAALISVAGVLILRGLFARHGIVFRGPDARLARRPRLGRRLTSFLGGPSGRKKLNPQRSSDANAIGRGST